MASLVYPGGIFVNLPSLIEQSGGDRHRSPQYPIKAEAFYPSGPTEVDESQPGGTAQRVIAGELGVQAAGSFPKTEAAPAFEIGSITSVARSAIEDDKAVSRSLVKLGDVNALAGVLTIDSIVTDLVAVHNGQAGTSDGATRVSGVRFLGLDAAFTDAGLVLTEAPPVEGPGAPLGDLLDPAVGPLRDATGPVQEALAGIFDQATPQVDDLLAEAGIVVRVLDPEDVEVESGAVRRVSGGVSITFTYSGRKQEALGELINSVPPELKPAIGPIPFPLTFFAENHITGFNLAPASVTVLATPPFEIPPLPDLPDVPIDPVLTPPPGGDFTPPGFETPLPEVPVEQGGLGPSGPGDPQAASNPLGGAIPALLVLGALLLSPLFGVGSTRLADDVLAPVSTSCPTGHDQPPPTR